MEKGMEETKRTQEETDRATDRYRHAWQVGTHTQWPETGKRKQVTRKADGQLTESVSFR